MSIKLLSEELFTPVYGKFDTLFPSFPGRTYMHAEGNLCSHDILTWLREYNADKRRDGAAPCFVVVRRVGTL